MFIVTNRRVHENRQGLDAFDSIPSEVGPNELRLAEAQRVGSKWKVMILKDKVDAATAKQEGLVARLDANGNPTPIYASQLVVKRVIDRLEQHDRSLLFFVHGYNNDLKAVLDRAQGFEDTYGVEVVAFSWPADGGGSVGGTLSYKSDKRDAFASVAALSRVFVKLADYLDDFNKARIAKIERDATDRFPDDDEKWNRFFTTAADKGCPFTVNLVLHSMGNYLYKHVLQSSVLRVDRLTFDNVMLVASDVNNLGHADWVDLIQCRNRVYITINEDDVALRASRMKAGEEQKARLGHYPFNLNAQRAVYVDFTGAPHVGDSHAYFEGKPVNNKTVRKFFQQAFDGQRAEDDLEYQAARRLYCCR